MERIEWKGGVPWSACPWKWPWLRMFWKRHVYSKEKLFLTFCKNTFEKEK